MTAQPNVILVTSSQAGALASSLFAAESAFLRAEHELEAVLTALYPDGWEGMEFCRITGALDVFGVTAYPAAVDALYLAGFRRVVEHPHPRRAFIGCPCRTRGDQ